MNPLNTYTSTGKKILRHLDELQMFQETGIAKPISLQIAPTSRCNLSCVFCSNVNRDKHEDLPIDDLLHFLSKMKYSGARSVEWTGGGDPTQYKYINDAIDFAHDHDYKQGMITNGVELEKKIASFIHYLSWIRISLNSLDYLDNIDIPEFHGTLGFSYVINAKTKSETLTRVKQMVARHSPAYVRVVPDCQTTAEELDGRNRVFAKLVESWGHPFFYQAKTFTQPPRCWWGHFKPFLLHDGYIYPCSSVVLNDTAERSFHEKFRWMTIDEFIQHGDVPVNPYDCKHCTSCVFGEQNEIIEAVMNPKMESFI